MDLMPLNGPPAVAPTVPGFVPRTLLGFGAHGEVWLADDLSSGGRVALKVGRRSAVEAGPDPAPEVALLCRINHPHIVRLQRVVPLPAGGLALVLDLASGGSLAALVAARGRFDPGEVSTLLVPLAGALEHLHRLGVVHGDIAPGNVLFTGEGRPQLGDLGVARVLGSRVGETWATPGFSDPALAPGGSDPQAGDVWGLAAVAWFALTGHPPDPPGLRVTTGDRGAVLEALLARCLTAPPRDRPNLSELADLAWQAARPTPVRLVVPRELLADGMGLAPLSGRETRRVPPMAAESACQEHTEQPEDTGSADGLARPHSGQSSPTQSRASWFGVIRTGRPARSGAAGRHRLVGAAVVAAVVAVTAVGVASTLRPGSSVGLGPVPPVGEQAVVATTGSSAAAAEAVSGQAAPVSSSTAGGGISTAPTTTDGWPESGAEVEAEVTTAMTAIGRARAKAFARASARFLLSADVPGSPAYAADLRLVQRLRLGGYRLEGVSYRVSEVTLVRRSGEQVYVRALVTTSEHRRVRVGTDSREVVEVPADGPRQMVFSLSPSGGASGPERWRIRSVEAATP